MNKLRSTFDRSINQSIIYHYCSDSVFKLIIGNKKLWFSDLYSMNDSEEFSWGRRKFVQVLKEYKDEFEFEFRVYLNIVVHSVDNYVLPTICSFSKNKDLLSQWRAYADDGRGFAIGIDVSLANRGLGVNVNQVIYDEKVQAEILLNTIRGLHTIWLSDNRNFDEVDELIMQFSIDLAYLKHPSFFEEQEVRLIKLLVKSKENIIDPGGNSDIQKIDKLDVLKRERGGKEIHYVSLPITINRMFVVKEIVIGPRNLISNFELSEFLEKQGLANIQIHKSSSPYR